MESFLRKLGGRKLNIISKITLILGIALLALSLWGFIKSSHTGMTGKNGSSATLIIVGARWVTMVLGAVALGGGFWLLKKSESMDDKTEETEEDDLDLP